MRASIFIYEPQHKDALAETYSTRAPFDRPILSYAYSLLQHALAVMFHFASPAELLALRGSGLPALVIAGEDDNLVDVGNSRALAQQLGATLALSPASGHMVWILSYCSTFPVYFVCLEHEMSAISNHLRSSRVSLPPGTGARGR
jgi:pimeloyl-ACP methyl ester carboxylesterase